MSCGAVAATAGVAGAVEVASPAGVGGGDHDRDRRGRRRRSRACRCRRPRRRCRRSWCRRRRSAATGRSRSGGVPVQVPGSTVSVLPSDGSPETLGGVALAGGAAVTGVVGAEVWLVEPPGFVAVTTTTIAWPASARAGRVARRRSRRRCLRSAVPSASQRCHWYVMSIGASPLHVPGSAVSVPPSMPVPLGAAGWRRVDRRRGQRRGGRRGDGGVVAGGVGGGDLHADRVADVACRSGRRCSSVAPAMSVQLEPSASQRCHWYV